MEDCIWVQGIGLVNILSHLKEDYRLGILYKWIKYSLGHGILCIITGYWLSVKCYQMGTAACYYFSQKDLTINWDMFANKKPEYMHLFQYQKISFMQFYISQFI